MALLFIKFLVIFFPAYLLQTTVWNSITFYIKLLYQEEICIPQLSYNCMLFYRVMALLLKSYFESRCCFRGYLSSSVIFLVYFKPKRQSFYAHQWYYSIFSSFKTKFLSFLTQFHLFPMHMQLTTLENIVGNRRNCF